MLGTYLTTGTSVDLFPLTVASTSIIVSRFLFNLRRIGSEVAVGLTRSSFMISRFSSLAFASRIVGNMGADVNSSFGIGSSPDAGAEDDDDDGLNSQISSVTFGSCKVGNMGEELQGSFELGLSADLGAGDDDDDEDDKLSCESDAGPWNKDEESGLALAIRNGKIVEVPLRY